MVRIHQGAFQETKRDLGFEPVGDRIFAGVLIGQEWLETV